MKALNTSTESFFELKYLRFICSKVQIISLSHHLQFIIYKRLIPNMSLNMPRDLKGHREENSVPGGRRIIYLPWDKG